MHSPLSCGFHACLGAFGDQRAFVFRKDSELSKDHTPNCCRCVDALGDGLKMNTARLQVFEDREQMDRRAAQPVQFPDGERVAFGEVSQHGLKAGTVFLSSRQTVIGVKLGASSGFQGVDLQAP